LLALTLRAPPPLHPALLLNAHLGWAAHAGFRYEYGIWTTSIESLLGMEASGEKPARDGSVESSFRDLYVL